MDPESFIVVQKTLHERAFTTFKKLWPQKGSLLLPISFEDYPAWELTIEKLIQIMAGDLQRIKVYREQVFKFHSKFPQEAWDAYEQLGSCRLYTTINKRVKQKSSFTG